MSVLPSDYATATYDTEMERIINNAPSRQKPDAHSKKAEPSTSEPRKVAISQVEHDTAGQQERVRRQAVREGQEDTRPQAEKFADAAREHGADQDEDVFKAVLRRLAKPKT